LLKVKKNIPPFAVLIKRINIASFRIRRARQIEEEEEMRFIKRNQQYKTSGMQPILPLVPERSVTDSKDKTTFITFDLKVRAGAGAGASSYKKHMRTFDEGTPQEWMESLTGLREIWQQNTVNGAHDRAATVAAVLKGDSRIAFDAAIEDARTDPNAAALVPLTTDHVEESLRAVTTIVFPFRALETQKQWMNKYMKKPYDLSTKMMSTALSRINNYLPSFPDGDANSKFTDAELVGLLDFSLPPAWRKTMDLKGYVASQHDRKSLVDQCEMIERNETPIKHGRDDDDDSSRNRKKSRFANSETKNKKSGSKTAAVDGQYYCKNCGTNPTHASEQCYILKRLAREKDGKSNGNGKAYAKPYTKRTFRKEVNAIARLAGKNDGLKIVESALKREQGKLEKSAGRASNKKNTKKAAAKKSNDDDTSSDESMNNMESRIPLKKQYQKKYASRTIRMDSHGKVIGQESDSDDDKKMPAKSGNKKLAKKTNKKPVTADPMETSSDESDNKKSSSTKEERAFLKSIDKKEKTPFDSTDEESE
jgi:hypothetical protein